MALRSSQLIQPDALIESEYSKVVQYESPLLQAHARSFIPENILSEKYTPCKEHLKPSQIELVGKCDVCLLEALTEWFKSTFFSWVNSPDCDFCGGTTFCTNRAHTLWPASSRPKISQINYPYYIDVEDHLCRVCNRVTKFPRHTDVSILLQTRKGRCSEWAQVFTLMCRALGYRSRLVLDVTDHVWTEVFCEARGKWIHVDSCEAVVDRPLLYEKGWGKQLTYIIAVGIDDVQDVSWRYSADHKSLLERRNAGTDKLLIRTIDVKRRGLLSRLPEKERSRLLVEVIKELVELMSEPKEEGDYSGRTSGDKDWVRSRSEDGPSVCQAPKEVINLSEYKTSPGLVKVNILYSSAENFYTISSPDSEATHSKCWQSITYKFENVFRKEERDWKMAYLARKDSTKPGIIQWNFDAQQYKIESISICSGLFVKEGAEVVWQIINSDGTLINTQKNIYKYTFNLNEPCSSVIVRVTLSSPVGTASIAWQHAQLFRESIPPEGAPTFGFCIGVV